MDLNHGHGPKEDKDIPLHIIRILQEKNFL